MEEKTIFEKHKDIVNFYRHINDGKFCQADFDRLEQLWDALSEEQKVSHAISANADGILVTDGFLFNKEWVLRRCSMDYKFLQDMFKNYSLGLCKIGDKYFVRVPNAYCGLTKEEKSNDDYFDNIMVSYPTFSRAWDGELYGKFSDEHKYLFYMYVGLIYQWNSYNHELYRMEGLA